VALSHVQRSDGAMLLGGLSFTADAAQTIRWPIRLLWLTLLTAICQKRQTQVAPTLMKRVRNRQKPNNPCSFEVLDLSNSIAWRVGLTFLLARTSYRFISFVQYICSKPTSGLVGAGHGNPGRVVRSHHRRAPPALRISWAAVRAIWACCRRAAKCARKPGSTIQAFGLIEFPSSG
jgi:hypothetical protein